MDNMPEKKLKDLLIKIDRGTCISTGNCIKVAPDVFEFDEEKICSFKTDLQENIERERLIEACAVCPVNVLYAVDENGKQLVP